MKLFKHATESFYSKTKAGFVVTTEQRAPYLNIPFLVLTKVGFPNNQNSLRESVYFVENV